MKKILIAVFIGLLLAGCSSDEEKQREKDKRVVEKQKEVCQESIEAGQQPSEFCISLLPEYKAVAAQPTAQPQQPQSAVQPEYQQQPQQYADQQAYPQQAQGQYPVQGSATPQVIVQQQPEGNGFVNGIVAAGVGYMAANALNANNNNNQAAMNTNSRGYAGNTTIKEIHYHEAPKAQSPATAPVWASASQATQPVEQQVKKPSAMDMSKLNSPIPQPVPKAPQVPKTNYLDTSKFKTPSAPQKPAVGGYVVQRAPAQMPRSMPSMGSRKKK